MTWTPVWGAGGDTRTDTEQAEWLADKIPAYGDYAKEAAEVLRKQARELASLRAEKERAEDAKVLAIQQRNEMLLKLNLAEAERDAALKDAERYRFLRHNSGFSIMELLFGEQSMRSHTDAKLDAAIDTEIAAIAARNAGHG